MAERHKLLLESPQLQEEKFPQRFSFSSSKSYILSIAALPGHYAASNSAPSNVIDIFDKTTLQGFQTLSGHEVATTSLRAVDNLAGSMKRCLVSSGKDGSVKAWDERSNSHSIKMTDTRKQHGILCCDVSPDGMTVAAGTELQGDDAVIVYWDPRQPAAPLRVHGSTHSDDITSVSFAPSKDEDSQTNVLLSASTDGLVSTSNADEDDEDEAVIQVGNWGCSVSQAGWIQQDGSASIWAASDMETFSTWTSELDQLLSLDIRAPVLHQRRTWVTDYLITAHSTATSVPNLSVFTGTNEGDVALLSNMNTSVPDAPWCLHKLWTHGHAGVVRSLLWDEENRTIVTGGEDTKINAWPILPMELEVNEDEDEDVDSEGDMDVDMASPKGRKRELDRDSEQKGKRARR
ncbi:WD40-repeat-containing domain protein [Crassisporium funariophilum]|nr:WD40-repeat-containing domain protein [Crassisporium funariophilum]